MVYLEVQHRDTAAIRSLSRFAVEIQSNAIHVTSVTTRPVVSL